MMSIFSFTAYTNNGEIKKGLIEAMSINDAKELLRKQGLFVNHIVKKKESRNRILNKKNVSSDDVILFCHEFAALLKAGISITETLSILSNDGGLAGFSSVLSDILKKITEGQSPSDAFAHYSDIFDSLFISALKTGERTGNLSASLKSYVVYLKRNIQFEKKVKQAIAYPAFLVFALFAVVGILFVFVMPKFVSMYSGMGTELPYATLVMIQLVDNIDLIALVVVLLLGGLVVSYRVLSNSPSQKLILDKYKTKIPVIGKVIVDFSVIQITSTMSSLLKSGLPLVASLEMTVSTLKNTYLADKLEKAMQAVVAGRSLSESLHQSRLFPAKVSKMIEAGESSGMLDTLLSDVSEFYEENMDHKMAQIMSLIEPIVMLFIGVIVGGIIIVMYLPIFSMVDVIQ
ncbi:Type IV fimbrial assembly protein PilC [hydrothermal vent metagenome]|uniref:Type IV fimbrial assembly protein PilC n=1 Tax=hydrothermal vent metagenome TaxID=652676 RepID=A0A3B0YU96_9ZZZZ